MNVEVMNELPLINGKIVVIGYNLGVTQTAASVWAAKTFPGVAWDLAYWFGKEDPPFMVPARANEVQLDEFRKFCEACYEEGDFEGDGIAPSVTLDCQNDTCVAISLDNDIIENLLAAELGVEDDEVKIGFIFWDWKAQFDPDDFNKIAEDIGEPVKMYRFNTGQDDYGIAVVNSAINLEVKGEDVLDQFLHDLWKKEAKIGDEEIDVEEYYNGITFSLPRFIVARMLLTLTGEDLDEEFPA